MYFIYFFVNTLTVEQKEYLRIIFLNTTGTKWTGFSDLGKVK